jgi:hypothetical protein
MNIPMPTTKVTPLIACVAIMLMAGAYLVFLAASWNAYQKDRDNRDTRINDLLDRIPKPSNES